jgi:hypothetical protein
MPSLRELQRAMYRSIVEQYDDTATAHIVAAGLAPAVRLDLCRNNFVSSLTNALRLSYPAVRRIVGDDFFVGAAAQFIAKHRPRSACLDDYGSEFPTFLGGFPPAAGLAYLPGVARLEWAISRALHAPDLAALNVRTLAGTDPEDRGRVCFVPHPAVGLVCDDAPVDTIWRAVLDRDDAALAGIDLAAGPVWLLVERGSDGVRVDRIAAPAWRLAAALFAEHPIEATLAAAPTPDAAGLIAGHLAAGHFIGFTLAARSAGLERRA